VQPLLPYLTACAAKDSAISLYTQPDVRPLAEIEAGLILYLGDEGLSDTTYTATLLGQETLVVIVHNSNPLANLASQDLQAIYAGETTTWRFGDTETEIQVWTYTSKKGPRRSFERVVLGTAALTSRAFLAPNPQAMLEAVAGNENAIGYLPASWLLPGAPAQAQNVHTVQLDETLTSQLHLPILALTPETPQGAAIPAALHARFGTVNWLLRLVRRTALLAGAIKMPIRLCRNAFAARHPK
jgi:hypothetical protein